MRAAACTASLGASRAAPRSLRAVGTRRGVAVRVAASSQQTIPVTFTLKHKVHFAQEVRLVGSHERLGAWDLAAAVPAAWSEGHAWTATVELPLGAEIEYKFAVVDPRHAPTWEPRYNRALTVAPAAAALVGAWNGEFAPAPASYDADDEEEQAAAAAPAAAPAAADKAEVLAEVVAELAAEAAPARPAPKEVRLSPQAEAAVGGIIEQAERVAADLARAAEVVSAELVAAAAPAAAATVAPAAAVAPKAKPAAPAAAAKPAAPVAKPAAPVGATESASSSKRRGAAAKPKRGAAAKANKPAPPADVSKYSPQQLEFLRRSGKL